jgi:hypothetical protein
MGPVGCGSALGQNEWTGLNQDKKERKQKYPCGQWPCMYYLLTLVINTF